MSIRRSANNLGINTNVELNPASSSTSAPTINNNIVFGDTKDNERDYPNVNTEMVNALSNPYKNSVQARDVSITPSDFTPPKDDDVNIKLLGIYTDILLSNNKLLLANIVSNQQIILSKSNLEDIITTQINKNCEVVLKPQQTSCISKISPFDEIDSIKITENDSIVDYKHKYNAEYNILKENYHISMKLVC